MRKKFLVFGSPLIGEEEIAEVADSLRSGWLSTGPKVARFEKDFKRFVGARYAAALNSCTAGLHLSLIALGIGKGDEVITTPMTFCATANSILHVGAKPIFVDVDPATFNIDAQQIERKITPRTKALLPVHFAGRPCNMDAIMRIARKHNLFVIEDAAHAVGAVYHGRKIGTIGDITAFSFYVTKNIVTGEGGMVTSRHRKLIDKVHTYALHGMSKGAWQRYSDKGYKHYQVIYPGFKYNMMDIQAAIGIHQLKRFAQGQRRRKEIWIRYTKAFRALPLQLPAPVEKNTTHAYHLYTILLEPNGPITRDEFLHELHKRNIGAGVHFIAVVLHPYYRARFGYRKGDFPNAERISATTISLPLSAKMTDRDVSDVIHAMTDIMRRYYKQRVWS